MSYFSKIIRQELFSGDIRLTSMNETTDLFGIPIPSTDRIFIAGVIVHIIIAFVAVLSGLMAMLADKSKKKHPVMGRIYFWSMLSSFVTIIFLAAMRWPHNIHLLVTGTFAFAFTFFGRMLAKSHTRNWTRLHTICMGLSYVLLLTGFYVDNGKNLPFWSQFPEWVFLIFPFTIGVPIIGVVLKRNPLTRRQ
jgi:hypothetical protein